MAKTNKPYKTTKEWEFWLKDGEIYRNQKGNRGYIQIDTGLPANVRWESSKAHFDHYFAKGIYDNPSERKMYSKSSVSSYARGIKPRKSYKRNVLPFGAVGAQAALSTLTEGAKEIWRKGKRSKLGKALTRNPYLPPKDYVVWARDNKKFWNEVEVFKTEGEARKVAKQLKTGPNTTKVTTRYRNPGTMVSPEIEDLSKEWHGREVRGQTEIEEIENYEDDLVHLGELEELGIWAADGSMYTITDRKSIV